ncbi:MAG: hypothetical protein Q7R48_02595 [bacterium]|nr:hypothetical protein [bacterium]
MDSLYDRFLREFQRLKKSPGFGDVCVSLPSISDLTLIWENDAVDVVYGQGEEAVWVLHVPKEAKPELAVSHTRGEEDVLQDMPDNRAESMAATLLEQLAKVEA